MTLAGATQKWQQRAVVAGDIVLGVILCICAVVMFGWFSDNSPMKHLFVAPNAIPSSTAISLAALVITALVTGKRGHVIRTLVALALAVSAAATLLESLLGADFGLAFAIGPQPEAVSGLTFPGPMAPNVSTEVLLLSIALALPRYEYKGRSVGQTCAFIVLLASLSALMGHALGVEFMCTMVGCIKIPAISSTLFGLASSALLLTQPDIGAMRTLCLDNLAGTTARKNLLTLLAVPIALALRALAVNTGVIDANFGWFLFGALMLALMWQTIGLSANKIAQVDDAKTEVEKRLQDSSAAFDKLKRAASMGSGVVPKLKMVCLTCAKSFPPDLVVCPDDNETLVAVTDDNLVGRIFAERYAVTDYIGRGGMCAVYKARHVYTERIVAVKVLLRHLASDPASIKRFQREAKAATLLSHANLLEVFDFGVTPDGQPFIVMEFVEGDSLDTLLEKHPQGLPVADVLEICAQVCEGLQHAHENDVIHRDLKPSNVMLRERDGQRIVQIVDFGLAKIVNDSDAGRITATSQVVGSPIYMGPEHYLDYGLGPYMDVYALGCMMYELLTGLPPFTGQNIGELVQKHLSENPPPLPESVAVSDELRACIIRMLDKDPEKRPSMAEILGCLRAHQTAIA